MLLLTLSLTACNKNKTPDEGKFEVYLIDYKGNEVYQFDIELPDEGIVFKDNFMCSLSDINQQLYVCRDLDYYILKPIE